MIAFWKHASRLLVATALIVPIASGTLSGQSRNVPTQEPEYDQPYTEEEYNAYEAARTQADLGKRGTAIFGFLDEYPESELRPHLVTAYLTLLYEYKQAQQYDKLGPAAEAWLARVPGDPTAIAYIAESAKQLGQHDRFVQYGEQIYTKKPSADLAYMLAESHKETGNEPKYIEYCKIAMQAPQYEGLYGVPWEFVTKHMESDPAKAAMYAKWTLETIGKAKRPESRPEGEWKKEVNAIRRTCHFLIGRDLYDKGKNGASIREMERTLKIDPKFDAPYLFIALVQERISREEQNLDKMEEAIMTYAKVVVLKGTMARQAKKRLETLYKGTHNNTLVGVERRYRRAAKLLGIAWP